ncbi:MAG: leucine-rich repeat domain-containing protein [Promethearchaeota archaeon]
MEHEINQLIKIRLKGNKISAHVNNIKIVTLKTLSKTRFIKEREQEFHYQCKLIHEWIKTGYNFDILKVELAFPLLEKLIESGNPNLTIFMRNEIRKKLTMVSSENIIYLKKKMISKYFHEKEFLILYNYLDKRKIKELDLSYCNLEVFPEYILTFKHLRKLILSNNQLKSLPENIGNLKLLSFLSLENNNIQSLPDSFGKLKFLKYLDLSKNNIFKLCESFGDLYSLEELLLNKNNLTKLPDTFGKLFNLKNLKLADNDLNSLPKSFKKLKSLINLNLFRNKLNKIPEMICKLSKLRELYLGTNNIKVIPKSIKNLENLTRIDLGDNDISLLPDEITELTSLNFLYLGWNNIKTLPESINKLVSLDVIFLNENPIIQILGISNTFKVHKIKTKSLKQFKINDYITLRFEYNKTYIYLRNIRFLQCMYLLFNIPVEDKILNDSIDSIDEAEIKLDKSLGVQNRRILTPEMEFWGHCSNLQAWAENDYDTRLLHRNLAFPLLRRLTILGDPLAKKVFKEEIALRLTSGVPNVVEYLIARGYLQYLNDEELITVIDELNSKFPEEARIVKPKMHQNLDRLKIQSQLRRMIKNRKVTR